MHENLAPVLENLFFFGLIPIALFEQDEAILYLPENICSCLPSGAPRSDMLDISEPIRIYETSCHAFFGVVGTSSERCQLLVGPVFSQTCTRQQIIKYMHIFQIPVSEKDRCISSLSSIPVYSQQSFLALLLHLRWITAHERLSYQDAAAILYQLPENTDVPLLGFEEEYIEKMEYSYYNSAYDALTETLPLIEAGNIEALQAKGGAHALSRYGSFSQNPREQTLTLFISMMTNLWQTGIRGGLERQQALLLAEEYISSAWKIHQSKDIYALMAVAAADFTLRIRDARMVLPNSIRHPTIYECIEYIRRNISSSVTVADAAAFSGYSVPYFSALFLKETGFHASEFIMECRLRESEHLLTHTTMKLADISDSLGFSNQSHFTRCFRSKYGKPPLQYRREAVKKAT